MSRRKLGSKYVKQAAQRIAGLKSIDPGLVLGDGISVESLTKALGHLSSKLEHYNTALSTADVLHDEAKAAEKVVKDLLERTLTGVATKFGKDSEEYKAAGGVKKSEKKHPHHVGEPASPDSTTPPADAKAAG